MSRRTASVSTPRQLARVPQTCSTAHAPQRPFPRPQSQTTHSYKSDDMPCASAAAAAWGARWALPPVPAVGCLCSPRARCCAHCTTARPVRASGLSPSAAGVGVALHPVTRSRWLSVESEHGNRWGIRFSSRSPPRASFFWRAAAGASAFPDFRFLQGHTISVRSFVFERFFSLFITESLPVSTIQLNLKRTTDRTTHDPIF